VINTRNWAGSTSSRSALSAPISTSRPSQQGQVTRSGISTCVMRGKCGGNCPRLPRRRFTCCSRSAFDRWPASASLAASMASISSKANSN
jgi:hypothetical protein